MAKGKLKKVFPGGNTSLGFVSLYHHIIEDDANRIFVIKGGPGVGKSSLMRYIGETMLVQGYDVEYHCCSSDNGSLDGVVIPKLRIAMLDGTAPHVVDPKNPGAVDQIIHLGDFWDEQKMRENKDRILAINSRVGRLFRIAYCQLREARAIHDEWESYITESMDFPKINKLTREIKENFFAGVMPTFDTKPKERHLFATAITPDGPVNYLDGILQDVKELVVLRGAPGTGKSTLVRNLAETATAMGLDIEVYNCALDPEHYDHLVVSALGKAIINASEPLNLDPEILKDKKVTQYDLSDYIKPEIMATYADESCAAKLRFWQAFNRAITYLSQAKATHDEMETYYIPAMDFEAINLKRDEILNRILKYAEEINS